MNAFISNILRYFPHVRESSSGGSRVGARGAAPLFFDQNEARRAEKTFLGDAPTPRPLYEGLDPSLSRTVLDSGLHAGFRIPGTGFQSLPVEPRENDLVHSLWVELGFWIPVVCGIPDSLSFIDIPDFKSQGSRF